MKEEGQEMLLVYWRTEWVRGVETSRFGRGGVKLSQSVFNFN